ncbi:hypothetical protein PHMEG_0007614 [Phytophthora megakarya]|uniref:HAT C-terminal dimerisation domain-containing protein n=1 Tax=Phytophthora megakarya TaxID=4795 RepID=A0A225WN37_9STRA|nr:hypothetical protein PHMEG_0007614 [Phytophthora megakarya]
MQTFEAENSIGGLNDEVDKVLQTWRSSAPKRQDIAVKKNLHKHEKPKAALKGKLSYHHNGRGYWRLHEVIGNVDICQWFREQDVSSVPTSIAVLARIWLGRSSTTAFQERVFSSCGIVMSKRRTRTENRRAEKQLLMKHNSREIERMKQGAFTASTDSEKSYGPRINALQ